MSNAQKTNEQAVVEAESQIEILKKNYTVYLSPIAISVQKGIQPTLEELLECQSKASTYFNYAESFVGNSGLLGAHENGKWVTGFAETCESILDTYITHINFLRSYRSVLGGSAIEPSKFAYANMQRMVIEYLPKEHSKELAQKFTANDLPTLGFTTTAAEDVSKISQWQLLLCLAIGVIILFVVVVLAVVIPNPTEWQQLIFRGLFSIGLAAICAPIPGFINVKARAHYLEIAAGGAIAVFVVTWFTNPPKVAAQPTQNVAADQSVNKIQAGRDVTINESKIFHSGNKNPTLQPQQARFLELLSGYQIKFGASKLIISRTDGMIYFDELPDRGKGVSLIKEIYGSLSERNAGQFEVLVENMPTEYVRFFSETRMDNPFVVSITKAGSSYLMELRKSNANESAKNNVSIRNEDTNKSYSKALDGVRIVGISSKNVTLETSHGSLTFHSGEKFVADNGLTLVIKIEFERQRVDFYEGHRIVGQLGL